MGKAYKLFRMKDGKLYPLYVLATKEIPMGIWLPAESGIITDEGKVKSRLGDLCYRPGWHLNDVCPYMQHIGIKDSSGKIAYVNYPPPKGSGLEKVIQKKFVISEF